MAHDAVESLRRIGAEFHSRGWSLGTSSNDSVVISRQPFRLLITASGKDKSKLLSNDFVIVDEHGKPIDPASANQPSAETLLHVLAAQRRGIGAVLHTHSIWATILSDLYHRDGGLLIEGYEMLKGLEGITTHEHSQRIEIFPNTQDISALAQGLAVMWDAKPEALTYGFLLRKHGLYTWGKDIAQARRHVEILEFLFEAMGRILVLNKVMEAS